MQREEIGNIKLPVSMSSQEGLDDARSGSLQFDKESQETDVALSSPTFSAGLLHAFRTPDVVRLKIMIFLRNDNLFEARKNMMI